MDLDGLGEKFIGKVSGVEAVVEDCIVGVEVVVEGGVLGGRIEVEFLGDFFG